MLSFLTNKTQMVILTLVSGGVGLLLLQDYVLTRLVVFLSRAWLSVEGQITASQAVRVVSTYKHRGGIRYRPEVKYIYIVNGKEYEGNRIDFGLATSLRLSQKDAEQRLHPYPVGAKCIVYYGPKNPAVSVLERKASENGFTLLMAIFILAIAGVALYFTLKSFGVL